MGVHCCPALIHQVRAGSCIEGVPPLVPAHVHLSVSLAEPGPSGGARPPRRCRSCSRPVPCLRDPAAPSFSRLLRQPAGGSFHPARLMAPRGARDRAGIGQTPARRAPSHTGALASEGNSATVSVPHAQRRRWATWSVTTGRTGGMSITWRRTSPTTSAPVRSFPQQRHDTGACSTTTSGSRAARFAPGAPGCLPCRRTADRASARRSARDWRGPMGSAAGGFEKFSELRPSSDSRWATRSRNASFSARNCSIRTSASASCSGGDVAAISTVYQRSRPEWWTCARTAREDLNVYKGFKWDISV